MTDKKSKGKNSAKDDGLRAAHQRDESAQSRDIERLSDKTPDPAEKDLGAGESVARKMRTQNEV
ncbi:MAG: hypothetical protein ABI442_16980 [Gemmatimonadaceae bacterium]